MPDVTYEALEDPVQVGVYDGDPILLFGYTRVQLEDGFVFMSPHTGFPNTVSEMAPPIEDDLYRELVVDTARRIRAAGIQQKLDIRMSC